MDGDKMLIKRDNIQQLYNLLCSKSSCHFSIEAQYKILKLKKFLEQEVEIYIQQLSSLQDFFEKDENGNPIEMNGGIKIKTEFITECNEKISEINNTEISIPDIYFTLEELAPLDLSLGELELLEPFIKN